MMQIRAISRSLAVSEGCEREMGRWIGSQATLEQRSPGATVADFESVLSGMFPSPQKGTIAFEFAFVPKPEFAHVTIDQRADAVEATAQKLEKDYVMTRQGVNGVAQLDVEGGILGFHFYDARSNADRLVVANKVTASNGRPGSLDARLIHQSAIVLSSDYDLQLAIRAAKSNVGEDRRARFNLFSRRK